MTNTENKYFSPTVLKLEQMSESSGELLKTHALATWVSQWVSRRQRTCSSSGFPGDTDIADIPRSHFKD